MRSNITLGGTFSPRKQGSLESHVEPLYVRPALSVDSRIHVPSRLTFHEARLYLARMKEWLTDFNENLL